jgi:hypothetical protein
MIDPRILTGLFYAALVVWSCVMLYAGSSFWKTISGSPVHRGDPMRIGVFATSIIFVAGTIRWIVAPADMTSLSAIFTLSIIDALYILKLMRAYGRGGPL